MRARSALVVLVTFAAASSARAQTMAVDLSRPRHPHAGLGGGITAGLVSARGLASGWLARLDFELLPVLTPPGRVGGFFGFVESLELWKAGSDWGLGIPVAVTLGVRAPGLRAGALFGIEAVLVDQVADDTGVGLYAPLAGARVTLDLRGWTAGVDARVVRRWQFGADDFTQWQVGFAISHVVETRPSSPIR